jgi:hypothetical protein
MGPLARGLSARRATIAFRVSGVMEPVVALATEEPPRTSPPRDSMCPQAVACDTSVVVASVTALRSKRKPEAPLTSVWTRCLRRKA